MPEFKKCPGCGMENLGVSGETEVHSKGCPKVSKASPKISEGLIMPLLSVMFLCCGFIMGFLVGDTSGEAYRRGAEQAGFYKELNEQCSARFSDIEVAYIKQIRLTNDCVRVLASEAVRVNDDVAKKAKALGIITQ